MGQTFTSDIEMDIPVEYQSSDGMQIVHAELEIVQVNPKFNFNLFVLGKLLIKGWKMTGGLNRITLTKNACIIKFNIKVRTVNGVLFCARFKRRNT